MEGSTLVASSASLPAVTGLTQGQKAWKQSESWVLAAILWHPDQEPFHPEWSEQEVWVHIQRLGKHCARHTHTGSLWISVNWMSGWSSGHYTEVWGTEHTLWVLTGITRVWFEVTSLLALVILFWKVQRSSKLIGRYINFLWWGPITHSSFRGTGRWDRRMDEGTELFIRAGSIAQASLPVPVNC